MEGPVWLSVTLQAGALFHWFRSYSEREIIIVLRTGFIDLFVSPRNVALLLLSVTLSFWLKFAISEGVVALKVTVNCRPCRRFDG